MEGDIVSLHWRCMNEGGEVLESSDASGEPTTFEVGAGDIVGNPVFEAFDEAVRGMAVGESATITVRVRRCTHLYGSTRDGLRCRAMQQDLPAVLRMPASSHVWDAVLALLAGARRALGSRPAVQRSARPPRGAAIRREIQEVRHSAHHRLEGCTGMGGGHGG